VNPVISDETCAAAISVKPGAEESEAWVFGQTIRAGRQGKLRAALRLAVAVSRDVKRNMPNHPFSEISISPHSKTGSKALRAHRRRAFKQTPFVFQHFL